MFQTDHLYFCEDPTVTFCATLDSYNPVSEYAFSGAAAQASVALSAALGSIKRSYVVDSLVTYIMAPLGFPEPAPHINILAFKSWFAKIKYRILRAERGTLIFAHVMAPHSPYMLNEDCSVSPNWTVAYRLVERFTEEQAIGDI